MLKKYIILLSLLSVRTCQEHQNILVKVRVEVLLSKELKKDNMVR